MTRRRASGVALALLAAPALTASTLAARAHPLHLASAQVAVEGSRVLVRLRTFQDDLESALARAAERPSVTMDATAATDSLYLAYLEARLHLVADGRRLTPELLASGVDRESGTGDTRVWWALLSYDADSEVRELGVRATLLYELFDDQRNVIRILHPATETRRALYFAAPDDDLRTTRFD